MSRQQPLQTPHHPQNYTTLPSGPQSFQSFQFCHNNASRTLLPEYSKQLPLGAPIMLHVHQRDDYNGDVEEGKSAGNEREGSGADIRNNGTNNNGSKNTHLFSIISMLGIQFDSNVKCIHIGLMHGALIFLGRNLYNAKEMHLIFKHLASATDETFRNLHLKFHVQYDSHLKAAPILNYDTNVHVQCIISPHSLSANEIASFSNGSDIGSTRKLARSSSSLYTAIQHIKDKFSSNWHSNIIVRNAYYVPPDDASHQYRIMVKIIDWDDRQYKECKFVRLWHQRVKFRWMDPLLLDQEGDDEQDVSPPTVTKTGTTSPTLAESTTPTTSIAQNDLSSQQHASDSPSTNSPPSIRHTALIRSFIRTNTIDELQLLLSNNTRGIIVYGASGVGKSFSVRRLVKQHCGYSLVYLSLSSVPHDTLVHTLSELSTVINDAIRKIDSDPTAKPTVVFVDDLHVLKESPAALSVLCHAMDRANGRLSFIGAAEKISQVPDLLRRHGRFDHDLQFLPPSVEERERILKEFYTSSILNTSSETSGDVVKFEADFELIAAKTAGFIISDLISLHREAVFLYERTSQTTEHTEQFSPKHYLLVLEQSIVRPSLQKEETNVINVIDEVKDVKWSDIGGLEEVKQKLRQCAEWPVKYKAQFAQLGLNAPRGILMYGPPGCGKTTLVKALARSTKSAFLSLNSAAVYSPYFGDAEKTIREVFKKARLASPSIIFFDEIDAMVGNRSSNSGGSSGVEQRVLSTILNEMDGIEFTRDVLVVAATNRPDMIDAALMRPGRLDYVLYVPPPDYASRQQAFEVHAKQLPLGADVDLVTLAQITDGYTGADVESLCREAAMNALRNNVNTSEVCLRDFQEAMQRVLPSVSESMLQDYRAFQEKSIK